jgi:hypothetical protein
LQDSLQVKVLFHLITFSAIVLAIFGRLYAPGWMILFLLVPYVALIAVHAAVHVHATQRMGTPNRSLVVLILASHVLFIGGFLLQWDTADEPIAGQGIYFPISGMLGLLDAHPASWVIALNARLAGALEWLAEGLSRFGIELVPAAIVSLAYEPFVFVPLALSWLTIYRRLSRVH